MQEFNQYQTPCHVYDLNLLRQTLNVVQTESKKYNFKVHYALKANTNEKVLAIISSFGLGADCVSGNEVKTAILNGFAADEVVFAGVGKSDEEIRESLEANIFCFNCESYEELEVINEIAGELQTTARVALRLNPNVDPETHEYISTGLSFNKFGFSQAELERFFENRTQFSSLEVIGVHFHIGSQIRTDQPFINLCKAVNFYLGLFEENGIHVQNINLGGGLGINYEEPDREPIPDFANYFQIIHENLSYCEDQQVHFELGRSIVGQCGNLLTRILYRKENGDRNFLIVDAGMNNLLRPALYNSYHKIERLSSGRNGLRQKYDVVGPICESSDCFGKGIELEDSKRGDLLSIRSSGAYGQSMELNYNLRDRAKVYYLGE
ncbi:MAG: diaminopimelate decarboxylase [Crocinitomicaceae bacterium]|nr:diaminopimelate decarboxylase [Crocinitomicaceae bacterium]